MPAPARGQPGARMNGNVVPLTQKVTIERLEADRGYAALAVPFELSLPCFRDARAVSGVGRAGGSVAGREWTCLFPRSGLWSAV